ncbi:acetyltransferase [Sphingobium sp. TCM1]|uniref:acetyltransferase n=1 Tax=Sphingobium sp. TCM1 TaxID=453246 RepID=UPI0007F558EA|nr:acetyltransferase [Sphingobium sp. TCM1]OAN56921.1 acetyltransferase [Sphingobium sp. TCM1]
MATDPFKYLDQMRSRDNQPETVDPFAADLQRQRDEEMAFRIKVAKPDEAARAGAIAKARGLPAAVVESNLPAFEMEARAARAKAAAQDYPAIGRWSAKGNNAAVAADDYDNLSLLGKAFYGLKNVGKTVQAGAYEALGGIYGAIGGLAENMDALTPSSEAERRAGIKSLPRIIADYALSIQKADQDAAAKARPNVDNWLARNLLQGVESLPTSLAAVGVGVVAGPGAGASVMGASVGGNEYVNARNKGLSAPRSLIYGASQGAVEFVTEKIPVSRLVGDLAAKSPLGKTLIRQLAAEIPGEQAATFLQDLNEWATLNPDKSVADFMKERPAAAAETLVATVGGVGATVGLTTATERTARIISDAADKRQQAAMARANGTFLDDVAEAAAKAKTGTRDPEALSDLIQQLGDDTGTDRVFIPGDAVNSYMQSDGYSGEFDGYRDAIDEALATGGDVVLPVGDLARIANTPAWGALKEDMRLSAGGMSMREAQTFDDAMADVIDQLSEQAAQEAEAARAQEQPRDTLRQSIADKLMNAGFTPATAMTQAELLTQREATRAQRMGRDLTGQEFDPVDVRQILPPALAQVQAADNTDILIETMKGGKDAKTAAGPSLMDFIARGGGIVDTGGDLKAMGADVWHKGKPGKRKLLRDARGDGQSSMLADGGLGVNEYGADAWAQRAWEAGYFPEFSERPSANDLLDAIAEGVAGRDRFLTAQEKTLRDAAQELRGVLENRGIDPDKATRKEIKDAIAAYQAEAEGRAFDQSYNDGPRGRIVFPSAGFGQGPSVIELFQSRDQSSFLHETGHLWLEQLRYDAADPDASDQIKADWQAVQDWFAANGHSVADGVIPVDAHEMWARGVERYLMEGKSPTPVLRRAFEAFRSWLVSIYRSVDRLKAPITPEIRAVMDRLIATDEEIEQARQAQNIEALFTDKPDAMTDDEFAAYQESTSGARDAAHDALLAKAMNAVKRRVTKEYKDRRATVEAEVSARIDARPEFRALAAAKQAPLDAEWIREALGEDAPAMLPKNVPPIYKDGGVNPDDAAELSGFTSGEAMVRALMGVETARRQLREGGDQRSVRKALIDQEVDALMLERYGDPFNDGSIEEEALAIIHNDQQGEVIAAEMRVLARSTGQRLTPYRIAKDWAARAVRQGRVADVASRSAIQRYQRAASKASKAAMDAVIAGDNAEAFRQKQAQMLNNALISEAKRAADDIEAAVSRMSKVASKRTMASVDQDYLERAQGLLEQVDLKQRSQRFIDRQEGFEAWAREQEEAGRDMIVPPSFAASLGTTNWSRLTVEQLVGLDAAVTQIMHLGRLKQKLLDAKEERDFEAVVTEAVEAAGGLPRTPSNVAFLEPGWWGSLKDRILSMDAALLKMETVFDWLDQGPSGVFNRVVFQRFVDAQEQRRRRVNDMNRQLEDARQKIPAATRRRWTQKVTLNFIDPQTGRPAVMTRDQLVAMALNMGNEGNAKKLAGGYGWNEQGILDMLNRELTVEEWRFVQEAWDIIDTLWPDIAALERRVNGVEPEKVEARPIETAAGTLRGGYYPVVYDPTRSLDTERQNAVSGDKLFESAYRRANTRAGATNERTKVERPVLLSLSVLSRHVGEVVHDITHREAVIDAHRFLNDKRVITAVREALGEHIQKQFNPWLQHIANEYAYDAQGLGALEKMVKGLRTNATFVGMGFRFSTTVMQLAGLINSGERIGARWVADGVYRFAKNPVGAIRFVLENSQEVAARTETFDRDIRDAVRREQSRFGFVSDVKRFAFYTIGMMDRFVSTASWIGAYNRGLTEGMDERQAIAFADKAVRQSQGAGAAKDLAAIQRGKGSAGEALKLMTMFYSYMSAFYQRQRTLNRDYAQVIRTRSVGDFPALLARTMMLYFFPALASELLAGRAPDDDEDWTAWAFEKIAMSALGPLPVVRDIAGGIASPFGYNFTPASGLGRTAVATARDLKRLLEGEETKRATRNILEMAGYLGAPIPGQVSAATQFLVDVGAGDQEPETFGEWWEGLTTGRIKED